MTKLNILLPTDFSDNAWSAIVYALKLYANEKCTFYLLHSCDIETSKLSNVANSLVDDMKKNATQQLKELKRMVRIFDANSNHEIKMLIRLENINDATQFIVKKHDIDLIVMGTKGATKAKEILFGSNTVKLIKKVKSCPVLAIPDGYDFLEPKQIAFPTDYNRLYKDDELEPLKSMAKLYNSKIRIVHINIEQKLTDNQEYNIKMLDTYLSNHKHVFHWLPDYTKKSKAIATFINTLKIEMLAMVNYKHSLFESLINEPVIKKLLFHPKIPILVIPE